MGVLSMKLGSIESLLQPEEKTTVSYPLYRGTVELIYNDQEHSYFVMRDGALTGVAGVTSVTGVLNKPNLVPWAVREAADCLIAMMEGDTYVGGDVRYLPPMTFDEFVSRVTESKAEYRRISQHALDVGHEAHQWLEDLQKLAINQRTTIHAVWDSGQLPLPIITPDLSVADDDLRAKRVAAAETHTETVRNCCKAGVNWMLAHNYRAVRVENKTFSKQWLFAGTFDCIALVDSCDNEECCAKPYKNLIVIADWKSSKGLYPEYRLQLAAYLESWMEEYGDDNEFWESVEKRYGVLFPQRSLQGRIVVKLGKEDGQFEAFFLDNADQPKDFAAFLGLTTPYERIQEIEESERMVRNLESSIKKAARADADAAEALRKAQARALRQAESENKKREEEAAKALKAAEKIAAKAAKEAEKQRDKEAKQLLKEAKKAGKELVQ
jgi:hypothetical protein